MTVDGALALARAAGLERLDARALLAHVLARPAAWTVAHGESPLDAAAETAFRSAVARRADGVPLAQITGDREFRGLAFEVTPDVLVPRPETELLVDWALALLPAERPARVVDLGTGSGAIAVALAAAAAGLGTPIEAVAVDASAVALAVARRNAARHGVALDARLGDWWAPVAGERFDLAVANPPYIAEGDPHLPALRHEPRAALVGGPDGLRDLAAIAGGAPAHLAPGGWLLLEHGHDQAPAVRAFLATAGFTAVETRHDLAGHTRTTGGRRA